MRRSGFTFIEAITIVAILGVVSYLSVPMYNSFRIRSDHRLAASHTQQGINRARLLAQNRERNSEWGFYIPAGILYKGSSYPARDTAFDETYSMPSSIAVSGIMDVSFNDQGVPNQVGDVVLTALTDDQLVIPIRFSVAVNTLVTEATESLVICDHGTTLTIVEAAWPDYQAGGATLNACSGGGSSGASSAGTSSSGASSAGTSSSAASSTSSSSVATSSSAPASSASSSSSSSSAPASSSSSSVATSSSAPASSSSSSSVATSSSVASSSSSSSAGTSSSAASSAGTSSSGGSSSSSSMIALGSCGMNYYPSTQVIDPTGTMEVDITSYIARVNFGTQSNPPLTSGNGPVVGVHLCYGESPTQVPVGTSFWDAVIGGNGICKNTSNGNSNGTAMPYSSSSSANAIEIDADKYFTFKVAGRYKSAGYLAFNQYPDSTGANSSATGRVKYLRDGDSLPSSQCYSGSCSMLARYLSQIGYWNGASKTVTGLGTCDMFAVTEFESLNTTSNLADFDDNVSRLHFYPAN